MNEFSAASPALARDVATLRARIASWRGQGERIALVPTMGALHAGHVSLVREARKHAGRTVMSIFVNPTQFAPSEDLSAYPRTFEADAALFREAGGDLLFAPQPAVMYGEGFATRIEVGGPAAAGLEDRFRPTHFSGVATVVAKLLNQCRPDVAIFGEKDYQQLKVVTRMARDLDVETAIIGAPTIRDPDGLALSSRNVYLSPQERRQAPALHGALDQCAADLRAGEKLDVALDRASARVAAAGFVIDYIEARHAESLARVGALADGPVRLLAAARLGKTRLIDNIAV
ncbi:pantoate--beta-alanine ligase [Methylocapsa palsarum]|uniref:Pantothenate synthetase n=1 Tax=Methylocapsa palsarum TaxID=1612308 RepID=A0A1I3XK29_9HYPH|nr:pantoate--beta-alanine ligase [Methylocapsa palsarum]SFK19406.1 pantoate--beta-alanine ligase [Methylocapsa palsarum]